MSSPTPEIRFYRTTGRYGFLSNFYRSPFNLADAEWLTVEHYFQAMKFLDPVRQAEVRAQPTPALAKRWGRRGGLRADWDDARIDIMRRGLLAKFAQHPALQDRLLQTGTARLVEAAPRDLFWGIGRDDSGENWLGRLLESVREELAQSLV